MSVLNLAILLVVVAILFPLAKFLDRVSDTSSPLIAASLLGLALTAWILLRRHLNKNALPPCACGLYGAGDYEAVQAEPGDHGLTFKCRCGKTYRLEGRRFLLLSEDGQCKRYKIKRHICRWADDTPPLGAI